MSDAETYRSKVLEPLIVVVNCLQKTDGLFVVEGVEEALKTVVWWLRCSEMGSFILPWRCLGVARFRLTKRSPLACLSCGRSLVWI
ncbi:unnamed protein product [Arabis nemorensis]|uniref:Uncharacterized protein n=1 Tax=Arabis nemorensis TaxID=586526 RepID=A0A565CCP4_9BRAS|nr:unnamed protein product [Arabis nemorensis]